MKLRIYLIFILLLCAILTLSEENRIILNVEFFPQKNSYDCGISAFLSILKWNGYNFEYNFIKKEIYSESAKGTFPISFELFLRKHNINYNVKKGSLILIKELLINKTPSIALAKKKILFQEINHYYVIVGVEKNNLIVHDGIKPFQKINKKKFIESWAKSNYWLLYLKQ